MTTQNIEKMDDIEVKAEVFRIIRANMHKSKSEIIRLIQDHLPDISKERIAKAIQSLL